MYTSSVERNTIARKPSHLGSNRKPSPSGIVSTSLASIGSMGGAGIMESEATLSEIAEQRRPVARLDAGKPSARKVHRDDDRRPDHIHDPQVIAVIRRVSD